MTIGNKGSVTHAIDDLRDGEHVDVATQKLWEHAFSRLIRMARGMLNGVPRGAADEEDIALSAFQSFCAGAAHGRFPDLQNRDNLWRVLYVITLRKVTAHKDHETAKRRDVRRVVDLDIDEVVGHEPAAEFVVMMLDELRFLLGTLRDEGLRQVARLILDGLTNQEVAERLDCHVRTIERKRELVRKKWEQEYAPWA